jgi:hypothetical protein
MMGRPVRDLQLGMSSAEYSEWIAYSRVGWLPDERQDFLIAQVCTLISNALRKKGSSAVKIMDFLPWLDARDHGISDPASQQNFLKALTKSAGGEVR